ncbi:DUF3243 domain-containing protein [Saliterribacillus persicus]|uniref:Uncharacterized protein DUF3243 n=1 Tax=Saliterribacillus persicus TaxID=930114 RepID=A0A368XRR6_9BACI|nr:DUF3243 domain-containing protein [Saliterribacillus persicus]RCW70653.1 uncharacterized protein DUF3243 [Saliterribacillus persicus]
MSVLDNFESWKDFLGDRLHGAQNKGMQSNAISEVAYDIGNYLQAHVEPKNDQERMLTDLWSAANEQERHAIANSMIKLVQNEGTNK